MRAGGNRKISKASVNKEVEAMSRLMVDNPMRGEFDAYKCMDYLEDKHGINLREEVKIYD